MATLVTMRHIRARACGGVLALVPEGVSGIRVRNAASEEADERDAWLTIAVPICPPIWSAWWELGKVEFVEDQPGPWVTAARRALDNHLDVLSRPRMHGLLVTAPIARALLQRISQASHDVVVVPAAVSDFPLRLLLRWRSDASVIAV